MFCVWTLKFVTWTCIFFTRLKDSNFSRQEKNPYVPHLTKWGRRTIEFAIVCPSIHRSVCLAASNNLKHHFVCSYAHSCPGLLREKHHYIIKVGDSRATRTLVLFQIPDRPTGQNRFVINPPFKESASTVGVVHSRTCIARQTHDERK